VTENRNRAQKPEQDSADILRERLALVYWATDSAIWDWDIEKGTAWLAPGNELMFGRGEEEVTVKFDLVDDGTWGRFIHPDDRRMVYRVLRDHVEKDTPYDVDFRCQRVDGEYIWIRSVGKVVRDGEGRAVRMLGSNTDVTKQKQAELETEWFREAVDNASEGIAIYDAENRFVYANQRYRELYAEVAHMMLPGKKHEEIFRAYIAAGSLPESVVDEKEFVTLLRRDDNAEILPEFQLANGTWIKRSEHKLPGGGKIITRTDITDFKRRERELKESEARFRAIFEDAAFGIALVGLDGRILNCNPALIQMLGYESEELRANALSCLAHPEDRAAYDKLSGTMEGGETQSFSLETRFIRKDGTVLWANLIDSLTRDDDAGTRFRIVMIEDISERKEIEEAHRKSEQMLRGIFDTAAIGIAVTDPHGTFIQTNPAYQEMLGLSEEDLEGKAFWDVTHPDDRHLEEQPYADIMGGRSTLYRADKRYIRKDGSIIWVSVNVADLKNADGDIIGAIATINDITERRWAEDALKESEAHLARAQEISHVGSWLWDIATDTVQWSAEHYRIFGLEPFGKDLSYAGFLLSVHEDDREMVDSAVRGALQIGAACDMEYRVVRHDGEIRRVHTIGETEYDESGTPVRMTGTAQDITEYAQVEEQLRQAQRMEAIGQLTGGIAHDFNNLLAVITGNLELIYTRVKDDGALRKMIERSLNASDRGASLTHRLLAFSRKQALIPSTLDLDEQVSNMTEMLSRTLGETIDIRTKSSGDLWPCYADPAQFEHALLNLSINARDAMPNGGSLTIETANRSLDGATAAEMEVKPGQYVVLAVSDSGTGISPQAIDHVFEPFFTTKEVGKGSGLGLSMVYGFAKQSGGTATISSRLDEGTVVMLYLPRSAESCDRTDHTAAAVDIQAARGERILVVEDDPAVRALTAEFLSDLGYDIAEADSAKAALEYMSDSGPIDLLLTDVVLPGTMNGPELAAEIHRRRPDVKNLFMTGYADEAFGEDPAPYGRATILHKPFKMAELANTLRSVLDTR
jgi:PAS domain S-box-containing protein